MVVVGSVAAEKWNLNRKSPKDRDIWITEEQYERLNLEKTDYHIMPDHIMEMVSNSYSDYALPNILYTIKCSHLQWDVHWQKTKLDILHMKAKGCILIPDLYFSLVEHWKKEKGDKTFLSLDKNKKEFFNDYVHYQYDHDYLHELVAFPNKPVYTKCLKDGKEVLIDLPKFSKLSLDEQIRMFREEITVIACERWLLNPHNKDNLTWMQAYQESLKKVIISLTKGWATDFIIFNLEKFVIPEYSYFENVFKQTQEGEQYMSNVDDKVFETLKEDLKFDGNDDYLAVGLADGDVWYITDHMEEETADDVEEILAKHGYEHIEQEGGGEGGSEYCYGIFKLDGKIYKAEWSYYSHHGYEEDGAYASLREVQPVQKYVTVYE